MRATLLLWQGANTIHFCSSISWLGTTIGIPHGTSLGEILGNTILGMRVTTLLGIPIYHTPAPKAVMEKEKPAKAKAKAHKESPAKVAKVMVKAMAIPTLRAVLTFVFNVVMRPISRRNVDAHTTAFIILT